jgi:hypothetical protein
LGAKWFTFEEVAYMSFSNSATEQSDASQALSQLAGEIWFARVQELRLESRTDFSIGAVVVPFHDDFPDTSGAFSAITKDISPTGIGIVANLSTMTPEVVICVSVKSESRLLRGLVRYHKELEPGWGRFGVEVTDVLDENEYPQLARFVESVMSDGGSSGDSVADGGMPSDVAAPVEEVVENTSPGLTDAVCDATNPSENGPTAQVIASDGLCSGDSVADGGTPSDVAAPVENASPGLTDAVCDASNPSENGPTAQVVASDGVCSGDSVADCGTTSDVAAPVEGVVENASPGLTDAVCDATNPSENECATLGAGCISAFANFGWEFK